LEVCRCECFVFHRSWSYNSVSPLR
jgi:hypothetical protein